MVRALSSTWTTHCAGKKRPMLSGPKSESFSGTPRFIISGQIFDAPKFEKSHQRSAGSLLTALFTQGQPTPETPRAKTIKNKKERARFMALSRSLNDQADLRLTEYKSKRNGVR